ncbi:sensor histidine kinase [Streptomyces sp. CFMR 7]|uniref:sensor histidine kinase n=1 Tax=Streptomyces sp. CFMR 7 TaxID=1649184 RepID=UPI0011A33009|nr:sensor histidine kinase [Streptomyces sp. CFMR 7]
MMEPLVAVSGLLGCGLTVTTAALIGQTRAKRALRAELAMQNKDSTKAVGEALHAAATKQLLAEDLEAELRHLAYVRLPALVDAAAHGQRGVEIPGLSRDRFGGTPVDDCLQAVLAQVTQAVTTTRDRVGLASRSSVRDVLAEMQTFLHRCQIKVVEEMNRYPQESVFHQSLMDSDHLVTLALHALQRMSILTGSWPGLQRADCTLQEVIASACGRIEAYQRVTYSYEPSTGDVWLEGCNVEPVTVALTELLSNATAYSEGEVTVQVQQFPNGYCIIVNDGGLSMNSYQREEAARLLARGTVIDFTTLPDPLQLGFAVIGRLAGEYGFSADVSSISPYGGVCAVLRVPHALLGHGPSPEELNAGRKAALQAVTGHLMPAQDQPTPADSGGVGPTPDAQHPPSGVPELPQRRRVSRRAVHSPATTRDEAPQDDPDMFARNLAELGSAMNESAFPPPTEGEGEPRHG